MNLSKLHVKQPYNDNDGQPHYYKNNNVTNNIAAGDYYAAAAENSIGGQTQLRSSAIDDLQKSQQQGIVKDLTGGFRSNQRSISPNSGLRQSMDARDKYVASNLVSAQEAMANEYNPFDRSNKVPEIRLSSKERDPRFNGLVFGSQSGVNNNSNMSQYNNGINNLSISQSGPVALGHSQMEKNLGMTTGIQKASMQISKQIEGNDVNQDINDNYLRNSRFHSNMYTGGGGGAITSGQIGMTGNDVILKQSRGIYQEQINGHQQSTFPYNLNQSHVSQLDRSQASMPYQQSTLNLRLPLNPQGQQIGYYQSQHQMLVPGNIVRLIPWVVLGIIGLWTFVFMIADLTNYTSWSVFQVSLPSEVITWHSSDSKMQISSLYYYYGVSNNYISLLDFIFQYFIARIMYALLLTREYFSDGACKNSLMILLFLKDLVVIILSITAGSYSNSASEWSGFGFWWMSTFAKLSILMTLQKIFFVRLRYFKNQPAEQLSGCSKILHSWGVSVYSWAAQKSAEIPEAMIFRWFLVIYLPLVLHIAVGIIEATFILIIWVSVLLFLRVFFWSIFEMCRARDDMSTASFIGRLAGKLRDSVLESKDKYWAYLILLFVIVPGVASCSFGNDFKSAMKFHFSGQQLMLCFYALPNSAISSYAYTMTFICNLLTLI